MNSTYRLRTDEMTGLLEDNHAKSEAFSVHEKGQQGPRNVFECTSGQRPFFQSDHQSLRQGQGYCTGLSRAQKIDV